MGKFIITWTDCDGDDYMEVYEGEEIGEYMHWLKGYIEYDLHVVEVEYER